MGFLDNSGDIILDAVLTDHGRQVLSRGDGSFQITKFALGDEEVDYTLYDSAHASGSAYYDLQILQTPILESFTDNAASVKSKLVTYESFDLLFLPVIKLNEVFATTFEMHSLNAFIVAVDAYTEDDDNSSTTKGIASNQAGLAVPGILLGESLDGGGAIRLDQGLDTTQISVQQNLPAELSEDSYTIQIDNRLGQIVTAGGDPIPFDYVDDDDIAYYTTSLNDGIVTSINSKNNSTKQVIAGPRGTKLIFKIGSSIDLNTSPYLFEKLGGVTTMDNKGGVVNGTTVYYIDSIVRVSGVKTGYAVDLPVRFVKFKS